MAIMFFFETIVSDWLVAKYATEKFKQNPQETVNLLEVWTNRSHLSHYISMLLMLCQTSILADYVFTFQLCVYNQGENAILTSCPV